MNSIEDFRLELGQASEIGMAVTLALMMFSVALGLKSEHFAFFKHSPRIFMGGIVAQLLALPAATLLICFIFEPSPSIALGMILIACCPGGNVSNLFVLLARGNTALSVSLTATSSVAAAFVTPVAIIFWSSLYPPTNELLNRIQFDTLSFLIKTSVILALPLFVGMGVGHWMPRAAQRLQKPLIILSGFGLFLIIVTAVVRYLDQFALLGLSFFALIIFHNAVAFLLGYISARIVRADTSSRRALVFEVGIQNSGLGIVILLTQLDGMGGAAAVAGIWGIWHIVAGLFLVWVFRRSDQRVVA